MVKFQRGFGFDPGSPDSARARAVLETFLWLLQWLDFLKGNVEEIISEAPHEQICERSCGQIVQVSFPQVTEHSVARLADVRMPWMEFERQRQGWHHRVM